jgi:hypothetical protein
MLRENRRDCADENAGTVFEKKRLTRHKLVECRWCDLRSRFVRKRIAASQPTDYLKFNKLRVIACGSDPPFLDTLLTAVCRRRCASVSATCNMLGITTFVVRQQE